MSSDRYYGLVERARSGDRGGLDELSASVRPRLYAYIYRIVLRDDVTQDIVQDSLLEMFQSLSRLEDAERFWPWLRCIAFRLICRQVARQRRGRAIPRPLDEVLSGARDGADASGLGILISQELKAVVFGAMGRLKSRYRAVLAMRCYEQMQYCEIAELMGCSEMSVRALFYRAKKSMRRQLSRQGLGKGFLVTALAMFGKMTAPADAAVCEASVTTAATSVGAAGTLLGVATSKETILSVAAACALAAGAVLAPLQTERFLLWAKERTSAVSKAASQSWQGLNKPARTARASGGGQSWYYYPQGLKGPVMTQVLKPTGQAEKLCCFCLEDEGANYYYDEYSDTIYLRNRRLLPAEAAGPHLSEYAAELQEHAPSLLDAPDAEGRLDNLLVVAEQADGRGGLSMRIVRQSNVPDEEYFRYNLPARAKIVDKRDRMHKRGWTYFRINGQVNGRPLTGCGRIPFFYGPARQQPAWLRLKTADGVQILDSADGAFVYDSTGTVVLRCPGGSFFSGLIRSWMGLHCVLQLQAAARQIQASAETEYSPGGEKATVTVSHPDGRIVYKVDVEKDVLDEVEVIAGRDNGAGMVLQFDFLQDVDGPAEDFVEPLAKTSTQIEQRDGPGMLWLFWLCEGRWR